MGRPKGSTSLIAAVASRKNGKKGGRPQGALPADMLKRLGPAPIDSALQQTRWYTTALAMLSELQLGGARGINSLADEIRKNVGAASRIMPHDILFSAAKKVRDDEDDLAEEGGPEDDEIERDPLTSRAVRSDG
jgi:hypothetical protein